jgi:hypothetical protein
VGCLERWARGKEREEGEKEGEGEGFRKGGGGRGGNPKCDHTSRATVGRIVVVSAGGVPREVEKEGEGKAGERRVREGGGEGKEGQRQSVKVSTE